MTKPFHPPYLVPSCYSNAAPPHFPCLCSRCVLVGQKDEGVIAQAVKSAVRVITGGEKEKPPPHDEKAPLKEKGEGDEKFKEVSGSESRCAL